VTLPPLEAWIGFPVDMKSTLRVCFFSGAVNHLLDREDAMAQKGGTIWRAVFLLSLCFVPLSATVLWSEPASIPEGGEDSRASDAPRPAAQDELDLATAVRTALENHPEIMAQSRRVEAARMRPRQASALPDPMIMAGVDKLLLDGEGADYMFQVVQSFPLSDIRGRRAEVERARAKAEEAALGGVALDRALAVRMAFFDVWQWDLVIATTAKSLDLARAALDTALSRYRSASAGQADVLRAGAEQASLEASLKIAGENRLGSAASLLAAMGVSPAERDPGDLRVQAPAEPGELPELPDLLRKARSARPELGRAQALVEEAEGSSRVARAQYYPQAQILSGYMLSTMGTDSYQGMLGVSVPLWLGWRNDAASEARARAEAGRCELTGLRLDIEKEVVSSFAALKAAMVSREILLREVLPRAEAAADAALAAYASGAGDLVSLIDAQRALYEIRLEAERARVDVCRRYARLMRAVGVTEAQDPDPALDRSAHSHSGDGF